MASKTTTLSKRKTPMRVLCLGQSRVGTSSAQAALQRLGFTKCYHYLSLIDSEADIRFWQRALDAKQHGKARLTRGEWDELLGEYAAVTDNPCCYFAEELIAAYPEAKVVLQTRNLNKWATSFEATIKACLYDPVMKYLCGFDQSTARWVPFTTELHETFLGRRLGREGMIAAHQRFCEHVKELVPKEKLLEWKVQDGWEPLCKHLEVDVPDEPFPSLFEKEAFLAMWTSMRRNLLSKAAWWAGTRAVSVVVVGMAVAAWGGFGKANS